MSIGRMAWIIGAAIVVLVVNVAVSFLYVGFYSYAINPNQPKQYYQEYAQVAAPYSSILAGAPLMFLMCWWVASWWENDFGLKAALLVWFAYTVIDVLILAAVGMKEGLPTRMIVITIVSVIAKLIAAYLGGLLGSRH